MSGAAFLNIEKSASGQRWTERLGATARPVAEAISQNLDLPELIGRVLAGRGVTVEAAASYLAPTLRDLMSDPDVLTGMAAATSRLLEAIRAQEKIAIFGDYDVDGACASALLGKFLDHYRVPFEIYIPDRIFEGYGPNPDAINSLIDNGAKLIVTVDCGAASFEALEAAADRGTDVIVLDHHLMGTELPPAVAIVNPNRQDDLSGLGYLCATGVVFMTLVSLARALREAGTTAGDGAVPDLMAWLDLAALATVCDVVPLTGLNRAFVRRGIETLRMQNNAGIAALLKVSRLDGPPGVRDLGFVLGPRINAGGRIGDAAMGSKLLITRDPALAEELAAQLDALNEQRKKAEREMLQQAVAEADAEMSGASPPSVLVTASEDWHPGVVGLLASRLKDRFRRPAFAITFDRSGTGTGSGRSIAGIDLGSAIKAAVDEGLLEKGGGHAMAAGLTIQRAKLGEFRGWLEARFQDEVEQQHANATLRIDGALTARSVTLDLIDLLEQAGPYGAGNPSPVFVLPAHRISYPKVVGENHISFTASAGDGAKLRAIAFRTDGTRVGQLLLNSKGAPVHLAGTLSAQVWQGARRLQFTLLDAAPAN